MAVIEVKDLTKDFGEGRGNFGVSFGVEKGEVFGFLGPNGAGKTTTIRQLMGFMKSDSGKVTIGGMDCFRDADKIHRFTGYLPGEIAFIDHMAGNEFIDFMAEMKGIKDKMEIRELTDRFELNTSGRIRKMSKGMKQKIGIVCALMGNPEVLILDEPTSGLDPLMQQIFVDVIKEKAQEGKTVLMSSHMFEEVEKTCSQVAVIKDGRIVAVENREKLIGSLGREYVITFIDPSDISKFIMKMNGNGSDFKTSENKVTVNHTGDINSLIRKLSAFNIADIESRTKSLEDVFMHYYGGEKR